MYYLSWPWASVNCGTGDGSAPCPQLSTHQEDDDDYESREGGRKGQAVGLEASIMERRPEGPRCGSWSRQLVTARRSWCALGGIAFPGRGS